MSNQAQRLPADLAQPAYRPARSIRPAVTAAEARQRHLKLVHAGLPGGRRFDDPVATPPGFTRRMKTVGLLLTVAATLLLLLAAG
jgi:hypothetical protein